MKKQISDQEMRDHICDYYDRLKMKALEKFDKGRAEHHESFDQINYPAESESEMIDLLNYRAMAEKVEEN